MPKKRFLSTPPAKLLAATCIALIFVERPLQAYADPGSGLLAWQVLGAVVLGAGYQLRRLVQKLRLIAPDAKQPKSAAAKGASRGLFVS